MATTYCFLHCSMQFIQLCSLVYTFYVRRVSGRDRVFCFLIGLYTFPEWFNNNINIVSFHEQLTILIIVLNYIYITLLCVSICQNSPIQALKNNFWMQVVSSKRKRWGNKQEPRSLVGVCYCRRRCHLMTYASTYQISCLKKDHTKNLHRITTYT